MRGAVRDGCGGPVIDEFPMNAIRAAGHTKATVLILAPRKPVGSVVFPIDVEEAHFVAARGVRFPIVAMHTEQFMVIGERFGSFRCVFLGKKNIRPFAADQREIEARLVPLNAVVALRVSDAQPRFVPHFELRPVAKNGAVDDRHGRLPAFRRPQHGIAGKLFCLLDCPLHAYHRSDEVIVEKQLLAGIENSRSFRGDCGKDRHEQRANDCGRIVHTRCSRRREEADG